MIRPPPSPLDDAQRSDFAWARYKRLMAFMALVTAGVVALCLWLLYRSEGFVSIHLFVAAGLGIGAAMMLTAALMGLVFLSSGTGHDDSIVDPLAEEREE